jgi:hypothetical protein
MYVDLMLKAILRLMVQLPARTIAHTVGPIYSREEDPHRALSYCYSNSLRLCKGYKGGVIAFSSISTGICELSVSGGIGSLSSCSRWLPNGRSNRSRDGCRALVPRNPKHGSRMSTSSSVIFIKGYADPGSPAKLPESSLSCFRKRTKRRIAQASLLSSHLRTTGNQRPMTPRRKSDIE